MKNKVLIFQPKGYGRLKRSSLYAASMFAKTVALATKYLSISFTRSIDRATTDAYIGIFWRLHLQETHTKLYVAGRDLLDPHKTYIFMSNHESWMDIPAIFGAVPTSLRMVTKIGLTKIPVFGRAVLTAGFIAIDRQDQRRAIKQLSEAKARLGEGISIWMAPEGTRSRDGKIAQFKKGGFYLAKELEIAIVPVFIEGAREVMPPDSIFVYSNRDITVHFCPPIEPSQFAKLSISDLAHKVRDIIVAKKNDNELNRGAH